MLCSIKRLDLAKIGHFVESMHRTLGRST
jgi:hypothetical protein